MLVSAQIDPDGIAYPFLVPLHTHQIGQYPGKAPGTMLTLEMQLVNFKIAEWYEPLSIQRQWCYADLADAALALGMYLGDPEASEPVGWVRAIDGNEVRRQSREDALAQLCTETAQEEADSDT